MAAVSAILSHCRVAIAPRLRIPQQWRNSSPLRLDHCLG